MSYRDNIEYKVGFREGVAIGYIESFERYIKIKYSKTYSLYKYEIRRLSEYEIDLLFDELLENKPIDCLFKYIAKV